MAGRHQRVDSMAGRHLLHSLRSPSLCFTASDGQMRAKSDVQLTSEFLCYLWEYSEHDIPNMPKRRNMIPMIRHDIVLWFCLFCERGRKLLKLWQHVTLCLLLCSLVFVQRLAEKPIRGYAF